MDVKEAVKIAKDWVQDVLKDENISNLGLEEITIEGNVWLVTIGFSRPWNTQNFVTALTGKAETKRAYRVVRVRDADGLVLSMSVSDVGDV